jgi:hypothetical protein
LYPENQLAVSQFPVSTRIVFTNLAFFWNAVPLGFWFGGFSSTAGYDPATKLNLR